VHLTLGLASGVAGTDFAVVFMLVSTSAGADPVSTAWIGEVHVGEPRLGARRAASLRFPRRPPDNLPVESASAARLRLLSEIAGELSAATDDFSSLLPLVARRVSDAFGDLCVIRLIADDGRTLEAEGGMHHPDPAVVALARGVLRSSPQRIGEGLMGRVAETGEPVLVPVVDAATLPARFDPERLALATRLNLTSIVCAPLVARRRVIGVVSLSRSDASRPYGEDDLHFLQDLAAHAALAIAHARSHAAEREARSETARAIHALYQSEEAHRLLFDASPVPLFVFDAATRKLLAVNEAALRAFGYAREAFLRLRLGDLVVPDGDPQRPPLADWGDAEVAGTSRYVRGDGSEFTGEYTTRALDFEDQRARICVVVDVTARAEAERALRLTEEQLRQAQKMEAVGRLAGGIAHDFNNLLSVVLSYGEILLEGLAPDAPTRPDLEEIRKAALRAAELTRQLLMFSRQQVAEPRVLDLNAQLAALDKMLHRILGEDIDLVSRPGPGLGRVRADPSHVDQVVLNLVVNARDAMPKGGQLVIETRNVDLDENVARRHVGARPGPHVMLLVRDTGTGMEAETLTRIFDPFFTTKEQGKGTGLGLSTVFGIVQQAGGSIQVESVPGAGSAFAVYLPRVDGDVDVQPAPPPASVRGSETILLVEDNEPLRVVTATMLRRNGYVVLDVPSPGDAIGLCERHAGRIHLLLTDVVMPQMSGPELAERLVRARPDMKVICMSGYTDDSVVRHGVLERHAFLQKPITPQSLAIKVRAVLDARGP
jgi:two-component system cell cycle sensor histidine kinase/response regulator CckA